MLCLMTIWFVGFRGLPVLNFSEKEFWQFFLKCGAELAPQDVCLRLIFRFVMFTLNQLSVYVWRGLLLLPW